MSVVTHSCTDFYFQGLKRWVKEVKWNILGQYYNLCNSTLQSRMRASEAEEAAESKW